MRILKIGLGVLSLLLAGTCAYLQHTFPIATGYTAHYLCLQAFYSHRNLDEVFKREILPIHPLFKYVTFEKDPSLPLIRASGFGVFGKSEAYFNKDIGCTVLTGSSPQRLTEM